MPQVNAHQEIGDITSVHPIMLDELENPIVKQGVDYWLSLRRGRRYPARKDLSPHDMIALLRNVVLVKVIDGGKDFEYRIAGEAQEQAYGWRLQGRRVSQVAAEKPAYGHHVLGSYRHVRESGEPLTVRAQIGSNFPYLKFVYCEHVVLPLGDDDSAVDHLLIFSAYVPRDFSNFEI
jgi:hypothetical protein